MSCDVSCDCGYIIQEIDEMKKRNQIKKIQESKYTIILCNLFIQKKSSKKEVMLGCNKNDATLALNYILKNSEGTISVLGMYKRDRNKNIIVEKNI